MVTFIISCIIFMTSPGLTKLATNPTIWELREQLVFFTGLCSITFMVFCITISARFSLVIKSIGGLNETYKAHKWAGIYSIIFALMHWSSENIPKLLVYLDIIPHPGNLGDFTKVSKTAILLFHTGVFLAEYAFYLSIILLLISLMKQIPYSFFRKTHKIFPTLFLIFAYHAATAQIKQDWQTSLAGFLLILLLLIGCYSALIALFQRIGYSRKVHAVIENLSFIENILEITLSLPEKPFFHDSGQYAFLQFAHNHEPHPFTIISGGDDPRQLKFAIKPLGDHTAQLAQHIRIGQSVIVEGPYGSFTFEDSCERQIWIAGGIGITPFLSRIDYLSIHGGVQKPVDLWYCTRGKLIAQYPAGLEELCLRNGITLHHCNSEENNYLTVSRLTDTLDKASIWFCGPNQLFQCLQKELEKQNFDFSNFHYDDFNMR